MFMSFLVCFSFVYIVWFTGVLCLFNGLSPNFNISKTPTNMIYIHKQSGQWQKQQHKIICRTFLFAVCFIAADIIVLDLVDYSQECSLGGNKCFILKWFFCCCCECSCSLLATLRIHTIFCGAHNAQQRSSEVSLFQCCNDFMERLVQSQLFSLL